LETECGDTLPLQWALVESRFAIRLALKIHEDPSTGKIHATVKNELEDVRSGEVEMG
jgi:hypothetical protein